MALSGIGRFARHFCKIIYIDELTLLGVSVVLFVKVRFAEGKEERADLCILKDESCPPPLAYSNSYRVVMFSFLLEIVMG